MAGLTKPSEAGKEAQYNHLGGKTYSSDGRGLFNGVVNGEWQGNNVAYFNERGTFLELEIISGSVRIWRCGNSGWTSYTGKFKVFKKQGGEFVDVTSEIEQIVTPILLNAWEVTFPVLKKGVYRFEYNDALRLDTEWYIEELSPDERPLFYHKNGEYGFFEHGKWQPIGKTLPNCDVLKQLPMVSINDLNPGDYEFTHSMTANAPTKQYNGVIDFNDEVLKNIKRIDVREVEIDG